MANFDEIKKVAAEKAKVFAEKAAELLMQVGLE